MELSQPKQLHFAVLAVDTVVLTIIHNQLSVLVIKIGREPFVGKWAVPGGLVQPQETLEHAAARHLQTKANINNLYLEQLYTFGALHRDPRGRVVSVAYMALVEAANITVKTTDEYSGIDWLPVTDLPLLAYDHNEIVTTAIQRLRSRIEYTNIICNLLPTEFTLTQLQKLYEIILDRSLDKRNFRKKILSLGIIEKSSHKQVGAANRPAQLYSFVTREPQTVDML